jgi:hypothetical protein
VCAGVGGWVPGGWVYGFGVGQCVNVIDSPGYPFPTGFVFAQHAHS